MIQNTGYITQYVILYFRKEHEYKNPKLNYTDFWYFCSCFTVYFLEYVQVGKLQNTPGALYLRCRSSIEQWLHRGPSTTLELYIRPVQIEKQNEAATTNLKLEAVYTGPAGRIVREKGAWEWINEYIVICFKSQWLNEHIDMVSSDIANSRKYSYVDLHPRGS